MFASTLKLTTHTVNKISRCKFTHTRDNRLACFFVCFNTETKGLPEQASQATAHLFLIGL